MRDIRSDLEERAKLLQEDITRTVAQCEKAVRRLQSECDGRVETLKAELAALGVLIAAERQRMTNTRPMQPAQSEQQRIWNDPRPMESARQRTPDGPRPMSVPPQSLSDFLIRKLAEAGPSSSDDLSNSTVKEGYFPDIQHASPGVQAALMELLSSNRIRALQDGRLAPLPLSQVMQRQSEQPHHE